MARIGISVILVMLATGAGADWTYEMTSSRCTEESRQRVAGIARDRIEYSVGRAEASIKPPAPIDRLSCLDSLMRLPLGTFAPNNALQSLFGSTLSQVRDPSGDLVRRVCAIAEREWRNITRPLNRYVHGAGLNNLPAFLAGSLESAGDAAPGRREEVQSRDIMPVIPDGGSDEAPVEPTRGRQGGVVGIWESIYGGRNVP